MTHPHNSTIRKQAIQARNALSAKQVEDKSQMICKQLMGYFSNHKLQHWQKKQDYVAIYLAMKNEVKLSQFIDFAQKNSIQLCVPVIQKQRGAMEFIQLKNNSNLVPNRLGILEPSEKNQTIISFQQIALALLPLTAFDEDGHRIGMGGGFYDRYFEKCNVQINPRQPIGERIAELVGVAFECQKIPKGQIERQKHDIKLDKLVSESHFYDFKTLP